MKCKNCGKPTNRWGNKHKLYCDINCNKEHYLKRSRKQYKKINCKICNKEFQPISIIGKYCSYGCKYEADKLRQSKKPLLKKCNYCEKEFKPYTSLDKFCSANCRIAKQKSKRSKNWNKQSCLNITGEGNPAYRNGDFIRAKKKTSIGEKEFLRIRNEIRQKKIEKYGYLFCDKCNINNTYQWEMHHLIYRSEKTKHEHLHNERNLIDLCMKCHNWFHKKKNRRNYLIEERNLTELFSNDIL